MQAWIISFHTATPFNYSSVSSHAYHLIVFNLSWISISVGLTYVPLHYGGVLYSYALFLKLVLLLSYTDRPID